MTHTSTEQPEALRLADDRPLSLNDDLYQWAYDAELMLRRLHARVQELEASQAQRVPLSDRKIRQIDAHSGLDAIEFARAIEAAHGITQEKQG